MNRNMQIGGGHFGPYDHDGDSPLDFMYEIEKMTLPKEFHDLSKVINKKGSGKAQDIMYDLHKELVKGNIDKLYKSAVAKVKSIAKNAQSDEGYMMTIVGVCILVAKVNNGVQKLEKLPSALPAKYPEYLRKIAVKLINKMYNQLDQNILKWKNINERRKALILESKLFGGRIQTNDKPKKIYGAKSARKLVKKPVKKLVKKPVKKPVGK